MTGRIFYRSPNTDRLINHSLYELTTRSRSCLLWRVFRDRRHNHPVQLLFSGTLSTLRCETRIGERPQDRSSPREKARWQWLDRKTEWLQRRYLRALGRSL